LNEIKYDYVDFKQDFDLTCCSNGRESTLQKTNDYWRQNHKIALIHAHS